jgi:hypothetical protein
LQTYQPEPEQAPEKELGLDDLEKLDLGTREGARLGRQIAERHYFSEEASTVWSRWVESVRQNFGYRLSEEQKRLAFDHMRSANENFLDKSAYDRTRRALVNRGILSDSCLTEEELLSRWVEEQPEQFSYQGKRDLQNRISRFGKKLLG